MIGGGERLAYPVQGLAPAARLISASACATSGIVHKVHVVTTVSLCDCRAAALRQNLGSARPAPDSSGSAVPQCKQRQRGLKADNRPNRSRVKRQIQVGSGADFEHATFGGAENAPTAYNGPALLLPHRQLDKPRDHMAAAKSDDPVAKPALQQIAQHRDEWLVGGRHRIIGKPGRSHPTQPLPLPRTRYPRPFAADIKRHQ